MLDTRLPVSALLLLSHMLVMIVFRRDSGLLVQGFLPQEIESKIDLPVRILKALSILAQVDSSVLMKVVDMPPINIIHAAAAHLMFPVINGIVVYLLLS